MKTLWGWLLFYSEHTDFSESTEEIAPLTAEEKTAKLSELRERLAAKRAVQSDQDKEDNKRNEVLIMTLFIPLYHLYYGPFNFGYLLPPV